MKIKIQVIENNHWSQEKIKLEQIKLLHNIHYDVSILWILSKNKYHSTLKR